MLAGKRKLLDTVLPPGADQADAGFLGVGFSVHLTLQDNAGDWHSPGPGKFRS